MGIKRCGVWGILPLALALSADAVAATFDHQDSANPARAARLWLPDDVSAIRGVIVWGNAGTGDNRKEVHNPGLQAWARHHGFGVVCTKALSFESAHVVLEALRGWARESGHPELEHIPFVATGHSNGGLIALGLARVAPHRTIAFAMNKAAIYFDGLPPATLRVPALLVSGALDLQRRRDPMRRMFLTYRARGALWAWVEEQGVGHTGRQTRAMDVIEPFLDQMISARLAGRQAHEGLAALNENEGWLAQSSARSDQPLNIRPFHPKADALRRPWLPNENVALLFRALATRDKPLQLEAAVANETGSCRRGCPGAVGAPIKFTLDTFAADEHWQRFEWFDGSRELGATEAPPTVRVPWETTLDPASFGGEATRGPAPSFTTHLTAGVHGVWVKAHRKDGGIAVSNPVRVVVAGATLAGLVSAPPLEIVKPPASATVTVGGVAEFSAGVRGGPDVRFQWMRNGMPLSGEIYPTLRLANQRASADGDAFAVKVSTASAELSSQAAILHVKPFDGAVATFTDQPPSIDGLRELLWEQAPSHSLQRVIAGEPQAKNSASFRALWDHESLYVLVEAKDDQVFAGATPPWANDTAEVYLEGRNEKGSRWGGSGFQFVLPRGTAAVAEALQGHVPPGVEGVSQSTSGSAGKFVAEFRIPETALGTSMRDGSFLGFEVHVNDCASNGKRRAKLAWHATQNNVNEAPAYLGTLQLVAKNRSALAAAGP